MAEPNTNDPNYDRPLNKAERAILSDKGLRTAALELHGMSEELNKNPDSEAKIGAVFFEKTANFINDLRQKTGEKIDQIGAGLEEDAKCRGEKLGPQDVDLSRIARDAQMFEAVENHRNGMKQEPAITRDNTAKLSM